MHKKTNLKDQFKALVPQELVERTGEGNRLAERAGRWWIRCPYPGHEDKHPSCSLGMEKGQGVFYCQVCKKGGDNILLAQLLLGLDFRQVLLWGKEKFGLTGGIDNLPADQLTLFAQQRGYRSKKSLGKYPIEIDSEKGNILFNMQLEWGGEVVGTQKRRANNTPFFHKKDKPVRSILEEGEVGFFLPSGPKGEEKPDEDAVPVVCEGETDAIAATDCGPGVLGIGVSRPPWKPETSRLLSAVLRRFKKPAVMVPDSDVSLSEGRAASKSINARLINVCPHAADLNDWLRAEGHSTVRGYLLGKESYVPLYNSASSRVIELVREKADNPNNPNRQAQENAIRILVPWIIGKILPCGDTRRSGNFEVEPGQWKFTLAELKALTGVTEEILNTVVQKLEKAGFWKVVEKRRGLKGGFLVEINSLFYWRR